MSTVLSSFGYLDKLKISDSRCKAWDDSFLENFTNREGWVVSNAATGSSAWNDASSTGGLGFFSQLASQQQQQGAGDSAASGDSRPGRVIGNPESSSGGNGPSFPSGGQQLGTASRRPASDPRQARLHAIERRSDATSNDENV
jgi:hypothetical protein